MSAKAAFSAFLADQAISICVPADRSVTYSSETSQPMQLYGAGVGMLQQCSWLGAQAPGCHTNRSCYFSGSRKSWRFLAMIFKSQLGLQKVLVVFKTKSNSDSSVLAAGEFCKVFDLLALGLKRVSWDSDSFITEKQCIETLLPPQDHYFLDCPLVLC